MSNHGKRGALVKNNTSRTTIDIAIIAIISIISYLFFGIYDVLEKIVAFSSQYERYEIDEIVSTFIVLAFCLVWFSIRRWRETLEKKDIIDQRNKALQNAFDEIKQLKGILPLCSFCKKIRDDSGYWEQVDSYIQKYSGAEISHSLCPECMKEHYPEEFMEISLEKNGKKAELADAIGKK